MQNQLGSQNKFIHLAMGETRANEEGLEQNQNNDSEVIKLVVKDLGHPLSLSLPSRNVWLSATGSSESLWLKAGDSWFHAPEYRQPVGLNRP